VASCWEDGDEHLGSIKWGYFFNNNNNNNNNNIFEFSSYNS
jgi:hypothetical protein